MVLSTSFFNFIHKHNAFQTSKIFYYSVYAIIAFCLTWFLISVSYFIVALLFFLFYCSITLFPIHMIESRVEIKIKNNVPFGIANNIYLLHNIQIHILLHAAVYKTHFDWITEVATGPQNCLRKCKNESKEKDIHKQQLVYTGVSPPRLSMRVFWTLMLCRLKWMNFLY
jgi:hypothetical protein